METSKIAPGSKRNMTNLLQRAAGTVVETGRNNWVTNSVTHFVANLSAHCVTWSRLGGQMAAPAHSPQLCLWVLDRGWNEPKRIRPFQASCNPSPVQGRSTPAPGPVATGLAPGLHRACTGLASNRARPAVGHGPDAFSPVSF